MCKTWKRKSSKNKIDWQHYLMLLLEESSSKESRTYFLPFNLWKRILLFHTRSITRKGYILTNHCVLGVRESKIVTFAVWIKSVVVGHPIFFVDTIASKCLLALTPNFDWNPLMPRAREELKTKNVRKPVPLEAVATKYCPHLGKSPIWYRVTTPEIRK